MSIAYPADISTPGYAKENLTKVRERRAPRFWRRLGQTGGGCPASEATDWCVLPNTTHAPPAAPNTQPPEALKLSDGKLFSPDRVARDLLRGVAAGDFILPNSSFLVGLLQTITAGLVPRRLLAMAWQCLLGALSPVICSLVAAEHDGVARQGAVQRFARLWKQGQAAGAGQAPPQS